MSAAARLPALRFVDIAVNLTDDMFRGKYRGKQLHETDIEAMLARSALKGVERIIITGTSLKDSRSALDLARRYGQFATAGIHPTSTTDIEKHPEQIAQLDKFISEELALAGSSALVAMGEIGLDYDRLSHSDKPTQLRHFPPLLALAQKHHLPLFLHSRHPDAHRDFVDILRSQGWRKEGEDGGGLSMQEMREVGRLGVVHSFTGSLAEMEELSAYGLYIGINGCSMKTAENLEVVKAVPLSRLMLETDAPWCTVTSTSAASRFLPPSDHPLAACSKTKTFKEGNGVKGRNEPCDVGAIAYVVAQVKGIAVEEVAEAAWRNTMEVFFPDSLT